MITENVLEFLTSTGQYEERCVALIDLTNRCSYDPPPPPPPPLLLQNSVAVNDVVLKFTNGAFILSVCIISGNFQGPVSI